MLLIVGLVLSGFALLFLIIGFSTPNWLEQDTNYITQSRFEKLGLWNACFKNYVHKAFPGKQFNGCWWIFSEEYSPIWSHINPPWFVGIQIMMTLTLIMEIMTVLIAILILIKCCPGKSVIGLFILGGTAVVSGILTAISVIIFGAKSVTDDQWMESPEKNFVSWSFGCVVFSGFLILFAGVSLIVAALQAKLVNDYDSRHDYDRRPAYAARHESRH